MLSWFWPENFRLGLDILGFGIVLFMNSKKINAVHGLKDTLIPSIVYAFTTLIAYGIWVAVFIVPLILISY